MFHPDIEKLRNMHFGEEPPENDDFIENVVGEKSIETSNFKKILRNAMRIFDFRSKFK